MYYRLSGNFEDVAAAAGVVTWRVFLSSDPRCLTRRIWRQIRWIRLFTMVYKSARNTSRILGVALVCFLFSFFFRLINIDFFLLFPPSVYEDCGEDLPNICTLTDMGCVSVCKPLFDDCSMSLTIFVCSLLQTQPAVWTQVMRLVLYMQSNKRRTNMFVSWFFFYFWKIWVKMSEKLAIFFLIWEET